MENKKRLLREPEILYQGGYEAIVERLDIVNIVKRVQKIESALSAVIKDDDLLIKSSREIYLKNTTLAKTTSG